MNDQRSVTDQLADVDLDAEVQCDRWGPTSWLLSGSRPPQCRAPAKMALRILCDTCGRAHAILRCSAHALEDVQDCAHRRVAHFHGDRPDGRFAVVGMEPL